MTRVERENMMKKDNCYCFSPYPKEYWGAMLALMGTSFFWLLDRGFFGAVFAAVGLWAAAWCICAWLTTVEISENGIRICQWKYESVPMTAWEDFCQAYLLDVTWTSTVRYVSTRHAAYYLLLTNHPIRLGDVREAGLKLGGARPCGKWRGHIALRLSEQHLPMVRQYIGQKLPLVEKCVEKDEATRL